MLRMLEPNVNAGKRLGEMRRVKKPAVNIRLGEREARGLMSEIARLGTFMEKAKKLGWNTGDLNIAMRLRLMWWKWHER